MISELTPPLSALVVAAVLTDIATLRGELFGAQVG
jgi:hypothetical protein